MSKQRLTKIIATLGPASKDPETIKGLIEAGTNVFRLNCSHSNGESREKVIKDIRDVANSLNKRIGILLDLQGPKIRVGKIENDEVELEKDQKLIVTSEKVLGTKERIQIVEFENAINCLEPGHKLLLDDGLLEVEFVKKIDEQNAECKVNFGGKLKNGKGVNFPHSTLENIKALTDKDLIDLKHGVENGVALIALSFVRSAEDIKLIKSYIPEDSMVKIIAKIEKPQAIQNLDEILEVADGIMVARGDLGVEIPYEKLPALQKLIIQKANDKNVLVITATQMLESMISSIRPTRAEVTDVANAIFDGTDAIMLSGETAAGKHPVTVVDTMHKLALEAEAVAPRYRHDVTTAAENLARSACELAERVNADAIVSFTLSGKTAALISKQRPPSKVIALTQKEVVSGQLSLFWGVTPLLMTEINNTETMMKLVEKALFDSGAAKLGDRVIITGGIPLSERGPSNFIKIHECEGKY